MHLYCLNVKRQIVQMKSFDPGGCACTVLYLTLLRASLHESDKADVADEFFVGFTYAGQTYFLWHQTFKIDPTLQLFPFVKFLKHI